MIERCGLTELCHQLDFKIALESLLESGKQSERVLQEVKQKRSGKLNIQDIKALDSSSKSVYLTVRARIRKAAEEEFPGNKIPTFRSNPEAKKRLNDLVKGLTETCTIKELGFEEEGIRSHIMAVLNERRRMITLGHSYEERKRTPVLCQPSDDSDCENEPFCSQLAKKKRTGRFDENDTDSTDILSSTSQSSLSAPDDEGEQTSETQLTLKSAEVILMCIFDETKPRDVKLHKQILPACRFLKVAGVRGHSKPTVSKKLAKAFIDHGYVVINSQSLANLKIDDVKVCPEKDIRQDLKDLSLSKAGV